MKTFKEILNESTVLNEKQCVQVDKDTFKNIKSILDEFEDEEGLTTSDYSINKKDTSVSFKDNEKADAFINYVKSENGKAWKTE
jgi:hypothetical protein